VNPKARRPIARMHEDMKEIVNDVIRYSGVTEPPGGYNETWIDRGQSHTYVYDRHIFASYTPWGVFCIFQAFQWRMRGAEPGDSKRLIKRDIQQNPHLAPKWKRTLLWQLKKASTRKGGRGIRAADASFIERIQSLKTLEEARVIRADLLAHPGIPPEMRENLLFNLGNYESALAA
jgi:hypothetical protein